MLARWIKIFGSILLVSWLANVALAIEQGTLGVKLNAELYGKGIIIFTSVVEFGESLNPPLSELDIVHLAKQAYEDMNHETAIPAGIEIDKKKMPGAITVLQGTDRRLYIGSSIKNLATGRSRWILDSGHWRVNATLVACQVHQVNESNHRTNANCGEQLTTHLFFNANEDRDLEGAKIVTWGSDKTDTARILKPCKADRNPDNYGCDAFVKELGLVAIEIAEDTVEKTPRVYDPPPTLHGCGDTRARAPRPGDQQG